MGGTDSIHFLKFLPYRGLNQPRIPYPKYHALNLMNRILDPRMGGGEGFTTRNFIVLTVLLILSG